MEGYYGPAIGRLPRASGKIQARFRWQWFDTGVSHYRYLKPFKYPTRYLFSGGFDPIGVADAQGPILYCKLVFGLVKTTHKICIDDRSSSRIAVMSQATLHPGSCGAFTGPCGLVTLPHLDKPTITEAGRSSIILCD
ncbi:hypothetical protein MVEN_02643000 [Mycena venus]|uniref:Uncharacterized protein n=1 Tax=Mycena venus TaxID=2733690 RepID=A0A8H6TWR6_9AGAR|nr:hypothetical protein MVEN_02643000 [Mycena venus]